VNISPFLGQNSKYSLQHAFSSNCHNTHTIPSSKLQQVVAIVCAHTLTLNKVCVWNSGKTVQEIYSILNDIRASTIPTNRLHKSSKRNTSLLILYWNPLSVLLASTIYNTSKISTNQIVVAMNTAYVTIQTDRATILSNSPLEPTISVAGIYVHFLYYTSNQQSKSSLQ